MANIRKTFNFRNGVQVDQDNLVVDSLGKVGIGTSVPTEFLDVRGTAKVVGLVTANQAYIEDLEVVGIATVEQLYVGIVSVSSAGIVTASSGIVTYYGDGGSLLNLPTSQWLDVDIGLGFTSIYAQGYVGVNTTSPFYPFQVGGTDADREFANVGATGVGIDSTGNIYSTGIITATGFYGSGAPLTSISASNISSGTLDTDRLPANINVSGIVTASSFVGDLTGNVTGNLTGNITGNIIGDVVGTASTADSLTPGADINVGIITSTLLNATSASVGFLTSTGDIYAQGLIGLGTASPQTSIHAFSETGSAIKLHSNSDEVYFSFGNSIVRQEYNGEVAFGNSTRSYGNGNSVDLVNYDVGSINFYLHEGLAGINTGSFNWVYGQDDSWLMALNYQGNLGIGVTQPEYRLHVGGSSTITDHLYVGNTFYVVNDAIIYGNTETQDLTVNGTFSVPILEGNVYATTGISTFNQVEVASFTPNILGVGTNTFSGIFNVYNELNDNANFAVSNGRIGIFTGADVAYPNVSINAIAAIPIFAAVGVGTTAPSCAVDFSSAGFIPGVSDSSYTSNQKRYMLLPRVTTSQRGSLALSGTNSDSLNGEGAVIYNTSTKTFQGYNGTTWSTLGGASGITAVSDDVLPELGGNLDLSGFSVLGTGDVNITGGIQVSGISTAGISTADTAFANNAIVSGVTTSLGGFTSGIGVTDPVQITVSGNQLVFTVPGVGTTSLTLF